MFFVQSYIRLDKSSTVTFVYKILIDGLSIPDDVDIFRVSNFTTIILVTEKFVETITNLNIKGVIFEEVKTIS